MTSGNGWGALSLQGSYFILTADSLRPVRKSAAPNIQNGEVLLGRYVRPDGSESWVLRSANGTRVNVNGRPLYLGFRVLAHKDEIVLGGRVRLYFSGEQLARIEPFPGSEHPVFCARSKQPIAKGTPAVRCPGCGNWCEQSDQKPAWTYGPLCPCCEQPTALDTGYRWVPEE
jgi:hypothetical protein